MLIASRFFFSVPRRPRSSYRRIVSNNTSEPPPSPRLNAGKSRTTNSINRTPHPSLAHALTPDWILPAALFPRNIRCAALSGSRQQGAGKRLGKTPGEERGGCGAGRGRGVLSPSSLPLRDNVEALLKFAPFVVQIFSELFPRATRARRRGWNADRLTQDELTRNLNTSQIDAARVSLNARALSWNSWDSHHLRRDNLLTMAYKVARNCRSWYPVSP